MGIRSRNVKKTAAFALEPVTLVLGTTAISQTGKRTQGTTIRYPFQVVAVEAYALTVTATISVDVQIGSTSVLSAAITPVADTPTAGVLSATVANTQSTSASSVLSLKYTSNGSGAATNGVVTVWIRPLGMEGDPISAKE
jgi:hypothetical protein